MSDYTKFIESALKDKSRYSIEPAIFIDGGGTNNRDDGISYYVYPSGEIARRVHIIDMPSLIPPRGRAMANAYQRFGRNDKRMFPREVTSSYKIGDILPTITFETRFEPKKKVVTGFNIYKSKVVMAATLNMLEVDVLYNNNDHPLIKALKLDPDFEGLFKRRSANRFGEDVVRKALEMANLRTLGWMDSRGLEFIKLYNYEGRKLFFPSSEVISDTEVKVTNPIRNFLAYVNLCIINSVLKDREPPFTREDLERFSEIANNNTFLSAEKKITGKQYEDFSCEELDAFVNAVMEPEKFAFAKKLLSEKPAIGYAALSSIANNDHEFLCPKWDIVRIRDHTLPVNGVSQMLIQIVLMRDGVRINVPINKVKTNDRNEGRVETAKKFWNEYFKDHNFKKSFWYKQNDVVVLKEEHDIERRKPSGTNADNIIAQRDQRRNSGRG